MSSQVEPVAVTDVVTALVGALTAPAVSRHFDLGSGERMEYAALLRLYADRAGLRRVQVSVPGLPTALVSRLAPALTRAPASTVQSLVESLHHDMVCGRQDFMVQLMPRGHALTPVAEALDRALAEPDATVPDVERDMLGPLSSDAGLDGLGRTLTSPAEIRGGRRQRSRRVSSRSRLRAKPTPMAAMTACIDAWTAGLASLGKGRSTSTPSSIVSRVPAPLSASS